jgi:hypothetical protein
MAHKDPTLELLARARAAIQRTHEPHSNIRIPHSPSLAAKLQSKIACAFAKTAPLPLFARPRTPERPQRGKLFSGCGPLRIQRSFRSVAASHSVDQ